MEAFDIKKLRWERLKTKTFDGVKINSAVAQHDFTGLTPAIGADPGRNWGISFVIPVTLRSRLRVYNLFAYWGTMPQMKKTQDYMYTIRDFVKKWIPENHPAKVCMIEGSSYERYGREGLEQMRLGFYEGFRELGFDVSYVPPNTPRKAVFGNGRIKAKEVWLELKGDAAASAAIALYASGYTYNKESNG